MDSTTAISPSNSPSPSLSPSVLPSLDTAPTTITTPSVSGSSTKSSLAAPTFSHNGNDDEDHDPELTPVVPSANSSKFSPSSLANGLSSTKSSSTSTMATLNGHDPTLAGSGLGFGGVDVNGVDDGGMDFDDSKAVPRSSYYLKSNSFDTYSDGDFNPKRRSAEQRNGSSQSVEEMGKTIRDLREENQKLKELVEKTYDTRGEGDKIPKKTITVNGDGDDDGEEATSPSLDDEHKPSVNGDTQDESSDQAKQSLLPHFLLLQSSHSSLQVTHSDLKHDHSVLLSQLRHLQPLPKKLEARDIEIAELKETVGNLRKGLEDARKTVAGLMTSSNRGSVAGGELDVPGTPGKGGHFRAVSSGSALGGGSISGANQDWQRGHASKRSSIRNLSLSLGSALGGAPAQAQKEQDLLPLRLGTGVGNGDNRRLSSSSRSISSVSEAIDEEEEEKESAAAASANRLNKLAETYTSLIGGSSPDSASGSPSKATKMLAQSAPPVASDNALQQQQQLQGHGRKPSAHLNSNRLSPPSSFPLRRTGSSPTQKTLHEVNPSVDSVPSSIIPSPEPLEMSPTTRKLKEQDLEIEMLKETLKSLQKRLIKAEEARDASEASLHAMKEYYKKKKAQEAAKKAAADPTLLPAAINESGKPKVGREELDVTTNLPTGSFAEPPPESASSTKSIDPGAKLRDGWNKLVGELVKQSRSLSEGNENRSSSEAGRPPAQSMESSSSVVSLDSSQSSKSDKGKGKEVIPETEGPATGEENKEIVQSPEVAKPKDVIVTEDPSASSSVFPNARRSSAAFASWLSSRTPSKPSLKTEGLASPDHSTASLATPTQTPILPVASPTLSENRPLFGGIGRASWFGAWGGLNIPDSVSGKSESSEPIAEESKEDSPAAQVASTSGSFQAYEVTNGSERPSSTNSSDEKAEADAVKQLAEVAVEKSKVAHSDLAQVVSGEQATVAETETEPSTPKGEVKQKQPEPIAENKNKEEPIVDGNENNEDPVPVVETEKRPVSASEIRKPKGMRENPDRKSSGFFHVL